MTRLTPHLYVDHLRRESVRFRAVLAGVDPDRRVPGCPEWDAAALLWHLTEVQWFWGEVLRRRPAPPDEDAVRPHRPSEHRAALDLFGEVSEALAERLAAAEPDEPAWSWADHAPDGQTVGFSQRRQAHEALIHRLDAEQAAGTVTPLDPALAADGVAEILEVMYGGAPPSWAGFEPTGAPLRVELGDAGGPDVGLWVAAGTLTGRDPGSDRVLDGPHLLVLDPDALEATVAGGDPAAVISGRAADVDGWLWRRLGPAAVTQRGDEAVLAAFAAAVAPALD